jgi:hypothetical protein
VRVQHGGVDYWQAGETGRVSGRWVE